MGLFLIIVVIVTIGNTRNNDSLPIVVHEHQDNCSVICQGDEIKDYPEMLSMGDNSILALAPSADMTFQVLGSLSSKRNEIEEHIIEQGDTLSSIADKFDISLETILWANNMSSRSVIQPGQTLVILPTTGVLHLVRNGDTVSQIAQTYKIEADDLIVFNDLKGGADIYVGDIIIVPEGRMPTIRPSVNAIPLANTYLMHPLPGAKKTQGLHWYNAVDFATGRCGDAIYASAGGTVQKAEYKGAYGYNVQILHPNNVTTIYAHMSQMAVSPGDNVLQGQVIGYVGYTGRTIPVGPGGCHLHFEVRGAANPF